MDSLVPDPVLLPVRLRDSEPRPPVDACMETLEAQSPAEFPLRQVHALLDYYIDCGFLPASAPYTTEAFGQDRMSWMFAVRFSEPPRRQGVRLPSSMLLRVYRPRDPYYMTESEVATSMLARQLGIPAPTVFFFDSSAKNPQKLEFVLMEVPRGTSIIDLSIRQAAEARRLTLGEVAIGLKRIKDLLWSLKFYQIGSLYFDWEAKRYVVGPLADYGLHDSRVTGPWSDERGPYNDWQSHLIALMADEDTAAPNRDQLSSDATGLHGIGIAGHGPPRGEYVRRVFGEPINSQAGNAVGNQVDGEDDENDEDDDAEPLAVQPIWHSLSLNATANEREYFFRSAILPYLNRRIDLESSVLNPLAFHLGLPDLHIGNIYINPQTGRITSILGWTGMTIMPAAIQYPIPWLASRMLCHWPQPEVIMIPDPLALPLEDVMSSLHQGYSSDGVSEEPMAG